MKDDVGAVLNNEITVSNIYSYGHFSFKPHNERDGHDVFLLRMKKETVGRSINLKNPKIAEKLMFVALEHFGDDFSLWVNNNIKRNPYISDDNVRMLFQLLDFIKTGQFRPGINAWACMMRKSKHERYAIVPARKSYDYSKTGLPIFTTEILKRIVSNSEEGVFYLLDIMNILFGRPDALTDTVSVKIDY